MRRPNEAERRLCEVELVRLHGLALRGAASDGVMVDDCACLLLLGILESLDRGRRPTDVVFGAVSCAGWRQVKAQRLAASEAAAFHPCDMCGERPRGLGQFCDPCRTGPRNTSWRAVE